MTKPPIPKKRLAMLLSQMPAHPTSRPDLEQVHTPGDVAAMLLENGWACGDIEDRYLVDLGCGTGILSFGAALLGAEHILGYDIAQDAMDAGREAIDQIVEAAPITFHHVDVTKLSATRVLQDLHDDHADYLAAHDVSFSEHELPTRVDTVIMNPPFGADLKSRDRGGDRPFLTLAFELADVVLSIHPTVSEGFLAAFARDHGFEAARMRKVNWALPARYAHHRKDVHTIEVGLYRFERVPGADDRSGEEE